MATAIGLTIEEFEQLPEALARNHELVDGELVDVSGNVFSHNALREALVELLGPYVREHKLGRLVSEQEYDFDGNAHGPDVSFFGPAKAELIDRRLRVQRFVPDLAIEIVSRGDRFDALFDKALRYRRCGTTEVYIFSIQTWQVFRYSEEHTVVLNENQEFRLQQIPGFAIGIRELFGMI
jgi:Uma2 family endonuclease